MLMTKLICYCLLQFLWWFTVPLLEGVQESAECFGILKNHEGQFKVNIGVNESHM